MSAEPPPEKTENRGAPFLVACAGLIGFCLGYALPGYAKLPTLFYDPVGRAWHVAVRLGPIPMGYYGLVLYGGAGAILCGGLAAILRRPASSLSERGFGLWAAWTLTAVLIVAAYFTWNNWP